MTLRVTHEALALLQESDSWKNWRAGANGHFTAEGIYGNGGLISTIWGKEFASAEDLDGAFCENMGGGVPREITNELVKICIAGESERDF